MASGHVERIDDLRQLEHALGRLAQEWRDAAVEVDVVMQRFRQFVLEERQQYWRHHMRLAERQLQSAHEALARTKITDDPRTSSGSTEAKKAVVHCQQRVHVCQQKMAACRKWATELDRSIDRFIVELSRIKDVTDQDLPVAAGWLARRIADLEQYAETPPPTKPG